MIGSGIAGMQSALLLAEIGITVYLLEREAFIGGKFPLLDITFPTNSCGICFLSAQKPAYCPVYECQLHENITLLPLTEIEKREGKGGDFQLTVCQQPRCVDRERCNLCGKCVDACPVVIPDAWGGDRETRKAIYINHSQVVPHCYAIDVRNCTRCGRCVAVCPVGAVDLDQQAESFIIRAGAIINAPGFEPFDVRKKGEYGFGRYDNVLSSIQFERMLSTSGATGGIPQRLSDGKRIEKLAIIQCVGSRDLSCGQEHCSTICCMIATKQALMAKERSTPLAITIFYMDIRPLGKDYERYYETARRTAGIVYRRSTVSSIHELTRTNDLLLNFVGEDGTICEESFDAVVLSGGYLAPPPASPVPGIFTASSWHGPADITETVMAGASAAALAAASLAPGRVPRRESEKPPEETAGREQPRIGVLFCNGDGQQLPRERLIELMAMVEQLPGVVHVAAMESVWLARGKELIGKLVKTHTLNRLILAGPAPRDLERPLTRILAEIGFNPALISFASFGEIHPLVSQGKEEEATVKARVLVKMAWERARRLQPFWPRQGELNTSVLVVGGGLAGMTASLRLAELGHEVYLVERESELGGNLRTLPFTLQEPDPHVLLEELTHKIDAMPLIHACIESELLSVTKVRGGYRTTIHRKDSSEIVEHGALVIATGGREIAPSGFQYGSDPRVITQKQLGTMLATGGESLKNINTLVMIQCVNSRDEAHPYCSRICCPQALKHALIIKELAPRTEIYVLYRDIRTCGFQERDYRRAREQGIIFISYDACAPPETSKDADPLSVSLYDPVLQERISLPTDLLVLSMGMEPSDNQRLVEILNAELDQEGFFKAANPKAAPLDNVDRGKYFCGLCLAPNNLDDVTSQANAVSARVAAFLSAAKAEEACQSYVVNRFCSRCGLCIGICPYKARSFNNQGDIEVAGESCLGCGACVVACNSGASRQYNGEKQLNMGVLDVAID